MYQPAPAPVLVPLVPPLLPDDDVLALLSAAESHPVNTMTNASIPTSIAVTYLEYAFFI
jgi:hypothetical protein